MARLNYAKIREAVKIRKDENSEKSETSEKGEITNCYWNEAFEKKSKNANYLVSKFSFAALEALFRLRLQEIIEFSTPVELDILTYFLKTSAKFTNILVKNCAQVVRKNKRFMYSVGRIFTVQSMRQIDLNPVIGHGNIVKNGFDFYECIQTGGGENNLSMVHLNMMIGVFSGDVSNRFSKILLRMSERLISQIRDASVRGVYNENVFFQNSKVEVVPDGEYKVV